MSHAFTRYQPSGNGRDFFIVRDETMTRGKRDVGFYDVNPPHVERFYKEEKKLRDPSDTVPFAHDQEVQGNPQRTRNYIPGYGGHAPLKTQTVGAGYVHAVEDEEAELMGTEAANRSTFKPNQTPFEQAKNALPAGTSTGINHSAKTMNAMFFSSTPVVPKSGALSLVPGEADLAPGYGGHKGRNLPESVLQTIKRERAVSTMAPSTSGQVASIKSSQAAHPKEIEQLLKKIHKGLISRGTECYASLNRALRSADKEGTGSLSHREFRSTMQEYGLVLCAREYELLAEHFDTTHTGRIDLSAFFVALRGSLNEKRRAIVERAFRKLDADGSGVVDMTDMRMLYNARGHPKVISGEMSEDDVLRSVLSNFDVLQHDGVVYFEEFENYYADIGATIDNDDYFVLMVESAWRDTPKKDEISDAPARRQERSWEGHVTRNIRELLEVLRSRLTERGSIGIAKLAKTFHIMDRDNSRTISQQEFQYAMRDFQVELSPEEVQLVARHFDRDGDGSIDYDEFLYGLRGELNETRLAAIRDAFKKLDVDESGVVTVEDIRRLYNCAGHPKVVSGEMTEEEVYRQFLDTFDVGEKDGLVHPEEFAEYYANISASIDTDEYFVTMMESAWRSRPKR